jgi:copper homeostasis protein
MEVCIDSLESAINAYEGGAIRVELCSSLDEGGLTPSLGLYKSIRKWLLANDKTARMAVNCMIRCRGGDFLYSDTEMNSMMEDVATFVDLKDTDFKVDGLVFGALDSNGHVDEIACKRFISAATGDVKKTFHRAFDVCVDWRSAFRSIENLGFCKLLTSGQKRSADEGRDLIRKLVDVKSGLGVIAGAGVNSSNLERILKETGCDEFHASCRVRRESGMVFRRLDVPMGASPDEEFVVKYTCKEKVSELVKIYQSVRS